MPPPIRSTLNRGEYISIYFILYKFLETRTLDRTNIGRDQLLKILGFSIYPLSFSFTVPFYTFEKSASEVPFSKTSSLGVKAPTPSKRIPKKKMLLSEDDN